MAREITPEEEIWVMTKEAAEITGYNHEYMEILSKKNFRLPDDERQIKIRKRSGRFYELWLPDLLHYIDEIGYGPQQNKK